MKNTISLQGLRMMLIPGGGGNGPADKPWEQLDDTYRESNRTAADHLDIKLRSIGLERRPKAECEENAVKTLAPVQAELLSKMEHARWCAKRWLDGWRSGEEKDPKDKIHPDLVPWDKLPEAEKKIDEVLVSQIFTALESIGQGAVPISGDLEQDINRSIPAHS